MQYEAMKEHLLINLRFLIICSYNVSNGLKLFFVLTRLGLYMTAETYFHSTVIRSDPRMDCQLDQKWVMSMVQLLVGGKTVWKMA